MPSVRRPRRGALHANHQMQRPEARAGHGDGGGRHELHGIGADDGHTAFGAIVLALQVIRNSLRRGGAFARGPCRRLDAAQHVAGRVEPRLRQPPALVDRRAEAAGVGQARRQHRQQRGLGHEAAGEDHRVAGDGRRLPEGIGDGDRLEARGIVGARVDRDDAAAGQHRRAEQQPRQRVGRLERLDAVVALDHRDRFDAAVAQRQHGGERDQLGADDQRMRGTAGDGSPRPCAAARRWSAR